MGWSVVNVVLPDKNAIHGQDERLRELVREILQDGYEPFATTTFHEGLVMSFRLLEDSGEPDFRPAVPGRYITPSETQDGPGTPV